MHPEQGILNLFPASLVRHCQRGPPPVYEYFHTTASNIARQNPTTSALFAAQLLPDRFCFVTIFRHLVSLLYYAIHDYATTRGRRGAPLFLDDGINHGTRRWLMDEGWTHPPDPISNSTPRRFDGCTLGLERCVFPFVVRRHDDVIYAVYTALWWVIEVDIFMLFVMKVCKASDTIFVLFSIRILFQYFGKIVKSV